LVALKLRAIDAGRRFSHLPRPTHPPLSKSFSLFLALRYLKPKRSFISVISIITLAGVTIGIAVLVVVIAVMSGFQVEMKKKILGHEPHLIVMGSKEPLGDWEPLMEDLQKEPGIEAVSPFVTGPVLLRSRGQYITAKIYGVEPEEQEKIFKIKDFVTKGAYDLDGDKCIMGKELAAAMHVKVGDTVTVHGPGHFEEMLKVLDAPESKDPDAPKKALEDIHSFVRPLELEVTGLFETGHFAFDQEFLLVPLNIAQIAYGFKGDIHGLALKTKDQDWARAVEQPKLKGMLGPDYDVVSWYDTNRKLFEAVEVERQMLFFIVSLVVLVSGFSIANTLITITFQKRREIGILKALGAARPAIVRVFMAQGVVVGIVGNVFGFGLAAAIIYWRDQIQTALGVLLGVQIFPREIYQFNRIPADIIPTDMMLIGGLSFAICVLAAVIPAWFAARLDPVRALREE
jgi:lipoprotein-releasing system permease protein